MTKTDLTKLTDSELATIIADPAQDKLEAMREAQIRRALYLRDLDPEAFEGTPESGPSAPRTPIENAITEAKSRRRRMTAETSLREASERWPRAFEIAQLSLADICFRIADETGASPVFIRRYAAELGLASTPSYWEERALFTRMDLEQAERTNERLSAAWSKASAAGHPDGILEA
jgi:hypothetical protein